MKLNIEVVVANFATVQNENGRMVEQQINKRNINRFPLSFMFQLITTEWDKLHSQIATTELNGDLRSQFVTSNSRSQIVTLNKTATKRGINISLHINNCFKENELEPISIVKESLTVQKEGDRKAIEQYGDFEIKEFNKSHDRFLIIDNSDVFHLGASLKDLGKKPVVSGVEPWFAFSQLNKNSVESILKSIV
jgi:hypothetical protein